MTEKQCPYFLGVDEKAGKYHIKCGGKHTLTFEDIKRYRRQSQQCVGGKQETCKPFLCRELERLGVHLQWSTLTAEQIYPTYKTYKKQLEEANKMDNTAMTAATTTEITEQHTKALELHEGIKADIRIVAQGLSEIGRKLKKMRDEKLYTELGHETFADYGKAMLGLEQRQLYSYIQIFETFGPRFIDEHSELGISKLLLLTNVPATEREEFIADNEVNSLTVRELKEMTEKYNKAVEQLSLLQTKKEETEETAQTVDELTRTLEQERERHRETIDRMQTQLKEIENRPIDIAVQEPDEETLAKIREEEAAKAKQAAVDEIKQAKAKAKEKADKAIQAAEEKAANAVAEAKKKAAEQAAEQLKASLESIERDKAEALTKAEELENKLAVAANPDTVYINFLLEGIQEQFMKVLQRIEGIAQTDADKAQKFGAATGKVLDALKQML